MHGKEGKRAEREIPVDGLTYHLIAVTNPLRPVQPDVQRFLELVGEELDGVLKKEK